MAVVRDELRTGLLVVFTSTVLAAVLIYLQAPGISGQRNMYRVYFDNANGINVGAPVMLAGRKVGQVSQIFTPVPTAERPRPELEAVVEVAVDPRARVFREERVTMLQYSLLAEQVIDFAHGVEASGLAPSKTSFIGERQMGLTEAGQKVLDKLDPVISDARGAIKSIQATSENLHGMTMPDSDLAVALGQFRQFSSDMAGLSGSGGAIRLTLDNLQGFTCKGGPLDSTLCNAERFTKSIANNPDIGVSLRNFRRASENVRTASSDVRSITGGLKCGMSGMTQGSISKTVRNAEQFTDTIKREPWRLIWPSKKKYPEENKAACSPTPCYVVKPVCSPTPVCVPLRYPAR
jgi:ABC-type transporter Mla subunit MlaD